MSTEFESSGDLMAAAVALDNALIVSQSSPYFGFPDSDDEDAIMQGRIKIQPFYERAIELARKRGDKITLATGEAQLRELKEWIKD